MATDKQKAANRANAQHSTGPTSQAGLDASARIAAWRHGLAVNHHESFTFLSDENQSKFEELLNSLIAEHVPQSETERILVRHMAESEWLRARAIRLQAECVESIGGRGVQNLALFIRYQTTHERAFHRSLKELQSLRQQKAKAEIGFVSQQRQQAAETRAVETLQLKRNAQNLQREAFEFKKFVIQAKKGATKTVQTGSVTQEMAA